MTIWIHLSPKVMFWFSGRIGRVPGSGGEKIVSMISILLFAAIAVMIVRKGVNAFVAVVPPVENSLQVNT